MSALPDRQEFSFQNGADGIENPADSVYELKP